MPTLLRKSPRRMGDARARKKREGGGLRAIHLNNSES